MSSGRKHTDKSNKSAKDKHVEKGSERKHKKEVKAVSHSVAAKPREESGTSVKVIAIFGQLTLIDEAMAKTFSNEYTFGQRAIAQSLKDQLNTKFNNNLEITYAAVAKSLVAPVLPE